jgi:hypothetical protein
VSSGDFCSWARMGMNANRMSETKARICLRIGVSDCINPEAARLFLQHARNYRGYERNHRVETAQASRPKSADLRITPGLPVRTKPLARRTLPRGCYRHS